MSSIYIVDNFSIFLFLLELPYFIDSLAQNMINFTVNFLTIII